MCLIIMYGRYIYTFAFSEGHQYLEAYTSVILLAIIQRITLQNHLFNYLLMDTENMAHTSW